MKNEYIKLLLLLCTLSACSVSKPTETFTTQQSIDKHFQYVLTQLKKSNQHDILVAAHRGDWRGAPENSIQGLKNCIAMGVDIVELDLKETKDGQLIVMHDNTIDRSTTGKGKPSDFTLAEIKQFYLQNGLGGASNHRIPTFEEFMTTAKGKMVIDVDKCDGLYPKVLAILEKTGTLNQTVVNTYFSFPKSKEVNGINYMKQFKMVSILDINQPDAVVQFNEYNTSLKPFIWQITFDNENSILLKEPTTLRNSGSKVWLNAMWPNLNAGHDDSKAVEEELKDETWGWLINKGANIIQTDRPQALLNYLRNRKLHP